MADREYLAGATGDEIRGTTAAGTPFPRTIVARIAALRKLRGRGRDKMPWWLGVDAAYWLGDSLEGRDGLLRDIWMRRFADDDLEDDEG